MDSYILINDCLKRREGGKRRKKYIREAVICNDIIIDSLLVRSGFC